MEIIFDTDNDEINNLISSFKRISNKIFFSSKRINYDEFNNIIIDEKLLTHEYINGCFSLVNYPRGIVYFNINNKWKMDLFNIYFMIKNNIIPNTIHDLPKQFKINRSNGDISFSKIFDLEAIKISYKHEDLIVKCNFKKDNTIINNKYNNPIEEIFCEDLYYKLVDHKLIMKLNNINNTVITLKLFSDIFISKQEYNRHLIYIYFNEKIMEWVEHIILPFFKKYNVKAIVVYEHI